MNKHPAARGCNVIVLLLAVMLLTVIAVSPSITVAQTITPTAIPVTPVPTLSLEERISELEQQVSELNQQVEENPKDIWDKIDAVSGLVSGGVVAIIGIIATSLYRRRETKFLEAQQEKDREDRKARLELEKLHNERVYQTTQTQLDIQKSHNEKELAVAQAQTVHKLLPTLQSNDEREKASALNLIVALDPDLALRISQLYESKDVTSLFEEGASLKDLTPEQRQKFALGLIRFGRSDLAVEKLMELSQGADVEPNIRQSIAADLERLGETEKATQVWLELALDSDIKAEERQIAVEALKQAERGVVEQPIWDAVRDSQAAFNRRIVAIEVLQQLDPKQETKVKLAQILRQMILTEQFTLMNKLKALNKLSELTDAPETENLRMQILQEAIKDPGTSTEEKLAAITFFKEFGHIEGIAEEFREIAHNSQQEISIRIHAIGTLTKIEETQEGKDELLEMLHKMLQTADLSVMEKVKVAQILDNYGYTEEATQLRTVAGQDIIKGFSDILPNVQLSQYWKRLKNRITRSESSED